jgi:hypothetical protein
VRGADIKMDIYIEKQLDKKKDAPEARSVQPHYGYLVRVGVVN